ncbi:hypothetical protein EFA69_02635 [Rufibacter immobilis]|uniref:Uncharacterized protein n=1 Tax=Rufibacter immobilis TaxID=1348778 RepID=A0A3M9N349_9BACT|nr:hypothetical protein [Rufibacter immobilis]RNI32242.1 hypothetical protein EFA69_02635 [Rufibacter immobilis]
METLVMGITVIAAVAGVIVAISNFIGTIQLKRNKPLAVGLEGNFHNPSEPFEFKPVAVANDELEKLEELHKEVIKQYLESTRYTYKFSTELTHKFGTELTYFICTSDASIKLIQALRKHRSDIGNDKEGNALNYSHKTSH